MAEITRAPQAHRIELEQDGLGDLLEVKTPIVVASRPIGSMRVQFNISYIVRAVQALRAQGAAIAFAAAANTVKTQQLPDGIDSQATGLNRVAIKMTLKKPFIDLNIFFSHHFTFVPTLFNFKHAIHHEKRRRRQP